MRKFADLRILQGSATSRVTRNADETNETGWFHQKRTRAHKIFCDYK